jgi:hypothetical protein
MKALLFIVHTFISVPDTLPTQKVLEASIDSFFAQKANIEITEFQTTNKFDWMKWLPSVGVGYALDGRPRPVANYSLDRFYTNFKTKEVNKLKTETLQRTATLEAQKLKFEVRILLKKYELMKTEIAFMQKNLTLEDDIFTVETDKYNRKETLPSDFLKLKQANQVKHQELFLKENELQLLEVEILNRCFWGG